MAMVDAEGPLEFPTAARTGAMLARQLGVIVRKRHPVISTQPAFPTRLRRHLPPGTIVGIGCISLPRLRIDFFPIGSAPANRGGNALPSVFGIPDVSFPLLGVDLLPIGGLPGAVLGKPLRSICGIVRISLAVLFGCHRTTRALARAATLQASLAAARNEL